MPQHMTEDCQSASNLATMATGIAESLVDWYGNALPSLGSKEQLVEKLDPHTAPHGLIYLPDILRAIGALIDRNRN